MSKRSIVKAKLLFFVAAVAIALLAGYCQGAEDEEEEEKVMKRVQQRKKMWDEAKLIGLNFAVQKQILKTFYDQASQFAQIFDTKHEESAKGIKKTLSWKLTPQKKKYLSKLDGMLAKALLNLRTDAPIIHKWILESFPSLFAIEPKLSALTKWLDLVLQQQQELQSSEQRLDEAKMPQEHPDSKLLFKPELVNLILHELDPVLEQMSSSTHRAEWRKEVKERFALISTDSALKGQLDKLNAKRVDYDSMYVRLAIVRATFHTGKIAYEEKERMEEKRKVDENQQEKAAVIAAPIVDQQKKGQELAVAVKNMENYAENLEIACTQMETALREICPMSWRWDDNIKITQSEMHDTEKGYDKMGFDGRDGFQFNKKAHGDMELFAQMLGKEPYVPAVDGPEVVLKYQLMLNAAPVWKLRRGVIKYIDKQTSREKIKEEIAQNRRDGDEYKRKMDGQAKYTYPGGEKAWQANRDDLFRRGHCPPLR